MSFRHTHITSFIGHEDPQRVTEFVARARRHFDVVRRVTPTGRMIAVVFYGRDEDNVSEEIAMPARAEDLSGILAHDVTIVSAWERDHGQRTREHVWHVPGTGQR